MDNVKRKQVIKTVRGAIIAAAGEAEIMKEKTNRLATKIGEKWQESKPLQQKAKNSVRKTAKEIIDFSKSVGQGVQEGVRDVRKRYSK